MASTKEVKLILVTGSVISGVGKGVVTSSLGLLLRSKGYRISVIKIDPYLNIDAGTFSPYEHGEVYVLDDGGEVDLDFGNYERFLNLRFNRDNNITTGKIYSMVIDKERKGDYLGKTVQIVPHITDAIIQWVERVAAIPVDGTNDTPDVCIIELGGTVGDIESSVFVKAFGDHFSRPKNRHRLMNVHVSMMVGTEAEPQKTKPMQEGISKVRSFGLTPDLLVVRNKEGLTKAMAEKISDFSQLELYQIVDNKNVSSVYRVPLQMANDGVLDVIIRRLELPSLSHRKVTRPTPTLDQWEILVDLIENASKDVKIALVGKYVNSEDAYKSVKQALSHAGIFCGRNVDIVPVQSEDLEEGTKQNVKDSAWKKLKECSGILVPGGFGERGVEGKIIACKYARENQIPFLGICLGMQCAAVEYARNVCNIDGADSAEFKPNLDFDKQVVIDMPEHAALKHGMGATMRLGRRRSQFLTSESVLKKLYNKLGKVDSHEVDERHRHRFEVNPSLVPTLTEAGLHFVGMGVDETSEGKSHLPATTSSAQLIQLAAFEDSKKDDLLDKVSKLCKRGGDGVTAAAVRMEILELKNHPYYVGVQYHPEYLSDALRPSAPFLGLVLASIGELPRYLKNEYESSVEKLSNVVCNDENALPTLDEHGLKTHKKIPFSKQTTQL
ncbi:unnamed protein product [Bursaphelenchus okinawaensis]|uniref:CTP synthase n=1 Tax=Bursaphelenchus okinawaensis TaxID=465554 RepID=A0A811LDP7_9BILA|nr:unnamed protein product [Bursaphelenchus okinawaensis]CAG9120769.1 unnamed protein product [Bursaphelenchus okinawaensis]